MAAGAQRYYLGIDDLRHARGTTQSLSFQGDSPEALAAQLLSALRTPALFERWRALQPDPDEVDAAFGVTDPAATVEARQSDLHVDVLVRTQLPHRILKHRLGLLIGAHWTLRDVKSG